MVRSHGGRTSMRAWISHLFGGEGEEDEENGRNLVWGGREREEKLGILEI